MGSFGRYVESVESLKHPEYQLALSLTQVRGREQENGYLVEGTNLVRQALASSSGVRTVFATPDDVDGLRAPCADRGVKLLSIRPGLLTKLTGTGYETAVTALAVVERKRLSEAELPLTDGALFLAAERIQDPRNVGVLIRTAEAAGAAALILSADSADPFSRAAVRSTTGSIVRLSLCIVPDLPQTLLRLRESGAQIIAGAAHAGRSVYDLPRPARPLAILVGNESTGISACARAAASDCVALPMAGGASSLNVTVAAGILLYEAVRAASQRSHEG